MPLSPAEIRHNLNNFSGELVRYKTISPNAIFTPGVKYLADACKAYWLIDAIASHLGFNKKWLKAMKEDERLRHMSFWTLKTDLQKQTARLLAQADFDVKPAIIQYIEYTDFPLDEIKLYVGVTDFINDDENKPLWVIYLPSEH